MFSKLQGVRKQGRGWSALCPAHPDTNPSLSIGQGDDGLVLLKCFADCSIESITAALGLKMWDLFPERKLSGAQQKGITVTALAADKGLPENFLKKLLVKKIPGSPVVMITYRLEDGSFAPRQRLRTALSAKDGSR